MAKITTITNPLTGQPAQVDQLDHTAQQIDDGLNIARGVSNPNLLDNWYFGNPVDQRQGRVVVPNTTYYSDNTLATSAGTTSAYVTAYRYATGTANDVNYASFKLTDSDTAPTYYAAPENVVRGYTGAGYGLDRWICDGVVISENGLTLTDQGKYIVQRLDTELKKAVDGKTVTVSALLSTGELLSGTKVYSSAPSANEYFVASTLHIVNDTIGGIMFWAAQKATIVAVKLELGTQQTLAHQENGVWVLNEIPDYGEQLARCQRYFRRYTFTSGSVLGNGIAVNSTEVALPLYVGNMRTISAVVCGDLSKLKVSATTLGAGINATGISVVGQSTLGYASVSITVSGGLAAGNAYRVGLTDSYINFIAEL